MTKTNSNTLRNCANGNSKTCLHFSYHSSSSYSPHSYRSSNTRSRSAGKVSQKCRSTFVATCTKQALPTNFYRQNLRKCPPSAKNWPLNLRTSLHKRRSCESKNLRFVGAKSRTQNCSLAAKFRVICVCFIALQVRQPEKGVAQNLLESRQFGSEFQQSIAK